MSVRQSASNVIFSAAILFILLRRLIFFENFQRSNKHPSILLYNLVYILRLFLRCYDLRFWWITCAEYQTHYDHNIKAIGTMLTPLGITLIYCTRDGNPGLSIFKSILWIRYFWCGHYVYLEKVLSNCGYWIRIKYLL